MNFVSFICFIISGAYAVYFSFDSLDGLVLMEGRNYHFRERNFSALVPGQVQRMTILQLEFNFLLNYC